MCHIGYVSNFLCIVFPIEYFTIFFDILSLLLYINRKK
nr:MAG TPA: hypothetical protein [Caudoviricetes sp.]